MKLKIIKIITDFTKLIEVRIFSCVTLYIYEIIVSCWTNSYTYVKFFQKKLKVDNSINQLQEKYSN